MYAKRIYRRKVFMLRSNGIGIKVEETRRDTCPPPTLHQCATDSFSRCYWQVQRLGSRVPSLSRNSLEPGRIAVGIVEWHHVADAVQAVAKDGLATTGEIGTTFSRSSVIKHTRNKGTQNV